MTERASGLSSQLDEKKNEYDAVRLPRPDEGTSTINRPFPVGHFP